MDKNITSKIPAASQWCSLTMGMWNPNCPYPSPAQKWTMGRYTDRKLLRGSRWQTGGHSSRRCTREPSKLGSDEHRRATQRIILEDFKNCTKGWVGRVGEGWHFNLNKKCLKNITKVSNQKEFNLFFNQKKIRRTSSYGGVRRSGNCLPKKQMYMWTKLSQIPVSRFWKRAKDRQSRKSRDV